MPDWWRMTVPHRSPRLLVLPVTLLVAACGGGPGAPGGSGTPSASAAPNGLVAPLLVQVENLPAARPQSGLQGADIVYEYVAEGGISRFSVLFFKKPSGQVGPIRSARLVTVKLVKLYGAVLVYAGAGTYVQQQIDSGGFHTYTEDSAGKDVFRTSDRSPPHNLYSDGERLDDLRARAQPSPPGYSLWQRTGSPPASGHPVTRFTVPVSDFETPAFVWDAAAGGFTRQEPDTGQAIDRDTGKPLVAPTVIVQQVGVTPAPQVVDVNGNIGVDHDLSGGGQAQVFTGGREYDARWSQGSSGPPTFTLQDGSPAPIASGLVWICLVPTGSPATAG